MNSTAWNDPLVNGRRIIVEDWSNKPLKVNEIIELVFQILKKYFFPLFFIQLLILLPLFLVEGVVWWDNGVSFFRGDSSGASTLMDDFFKGNSMESLLSDIFWLVRSLFLLLIMFFLILVSIPIGNAAIIFAVDQIRRGETIQLIGVIKLAISRFWPMAGGMFVNGFIFFGMNLSILLILGFAGGMIWYTDGFAGNPLALILVIIGMILFGIGAFLGSLYIMTRLSFYLPPILFNSPAPGINESLRLTKNHFWRLLGLGIIIMIICSLITGAIDTGVNLIFGESILGNFLFNVLSIYSYLISFVAYAVVYFDLKNRIGDDNTFE